MKLALYILLKQKPLKKY